jgi:hypothetical protein
MSFLCKLFSIPSSHTLTVPGLKFSIGGRAQSTLAEVGVSDFLGNCTVLRYEGQKFRKIAYVFCARSLVKLKLQHCLEFVY